MIKRRVSHGLERKSKLGLQLKTKLDDESVAFPVKPYAGYITDIRYGSVTAGNVVASIITNHVLITKQSNICWPLNN